MRLYVMRHGPAEDQSATGRDEDRALTPSGRDRVRGVAGWLVKRGELPGRIVTSRLVRAAQTADIVQSAMSAAGTQVGIETAREMAPGGSSFELVQGFREGGEAVDSRMVVGHEPDLSQLVERLVGEAMHVGMDKAMVVALELEGEKVSLRWILDPRSLEIVPDPRGS